MKIFSKICWKPEAVFVRPTVVLVSGLERSRECTEFSGEKILSARLETSARGVRSEVRQDELLHSNYLREERRLTSPGPRSGHLLV